MNAKDRRITIAVVALVCALGLPSAASADTITLNPTADTFVRAADPGTNFGGANYIDSHGGLASYSCENDASHHVGPSYAYLKFNLASIPEGAIIDSVDLQLYSRSGYAWDGDPDQHVRFVGDDTWSEGGMDYGNRPAADATNLASRFIFYDNPICGDPKPFPPGGQIPALQSFSSGPLAAKVDDERSDGTLSLQIFNPNAAVTQRGANMGYWVRFLSRESASPPKLVVDYHLPVPELYDAVPSASETTVVGRIRDGVPGATYTLRAFSSATCAGNDIGDNAAQLGETFTVTTDAAGNAFYAHQIAATPPLDSFVAVRSESGAAVSGLSRCVPAPDNDSWPRARQLNSTDVDQAIDLDGQARWYKLDVQPNSDVTVDLTSLAKNYDLYVFKDIGATLTDVADAQDLLELSAEFAGEASAPSAFSPSAFSPSAFSPSAFSPSAFSPSAFSPSAFSPSAFSPSAFSPSAFSPSAFSPSAFSPSAFSPSAFSPESYSSAQVRSLLAASLNDGTAPESIHLNSWGNTRLYVMVTGRQGASAVADDFHLHVTADGSTCAGVLPAPATVDPPTETNLKTLILADLPRMGLTWTSPLATKLETLKSRIEVGGKVIRLNELSRIQNLNLQADQHKACPYAKNLVASAIKDVVDAYQKKNPGLKYIVVVGNDNAVPFFRYPDTAGLGPETGFSPPVKDDTASQASLRRGYVLSQDAYGSTTEISLKDSSFPVPGMAVGRLAETPAAITKVIDAYLGTSGGVRPRPTSSLVTGYDFLTDAADKVNEEFSDGLGATAVRKDTLITDADVPRTDVGDPRRHSWDADRLRDKLFGSKHDLMFLAGHFNSSEALAADYSTKVNTTELVNSTTDFTNSIVTSAGCHSGYNVVDEDAIPAVTPTLDWAEAFAQKGATLIGGTGYQYGDTDFLEYSERLYADFAHQLRVGTGPVSLGDALVRAKQQYLADTPLMRGIHQKALLQATLFGLPMLSVDLPGRSGTPGPGSIVSGADFTDADTDPGATLGLSYTDVTLDTPTTEVPKTLDNLGGGQTTATYLKGLDGVLTNPGEPALPLQRGGATFPGTPVKVLRGVGLRSGAFADEHGVTPLTGAATTEQQAVHTPFAPSVFFPSRLWSVNYFDALSGGGATTLSVTPAQYKADVPGSSTSTQRAYTKLKLRLFYSGWTAPAGLNRPALAGPPAIAKIEDSVDGDTLKFRANVVGDPSAGIQQVWIAYHGLHAGMWESLDLHQDDTDTTLWTGSLPLEGKSPSAVHYVVQAVNGVGVASLDDNLGRYYTPAGEAPGATQGTSLALVSPPSGGAYGSNANVTAELLDAGGAPLAGKLVIFTVGGATQAARTGDDGRATASLPLLDSPDDDYRLRASFAEDGTYRASEDSRAFTISRQATALTLTPASSRLTETEVGPTATLTAGGSPLVAQTVLFVLKRADGSVAGQYARLTDADGRARIGIEGVPAGTYTVNAFYGGTRGTVALGDPTPYTTADATATVTVFTFSGFFAPVDNAPTVNQVSAGRAVPVKFSLGYAAGLDVFSGDYPLVKTLTCSATAPVDTVEQTVTANGNSLSYDAATKEYSFVWKTNKAWAGTCKRLVLRFTNSPDHIVDFKFTK